MDFAYDSGVTLTRASAHNQRLSLSARAARGTGGAFHTWRSVTDQA